MLHPNSADTFQILDQREYSLDEVHRLRLSLIRMIYLSNGVPW